MALTDWELASRLSYFLWDSMPDPALYEAAASGNLNTVEGVEAQARRMLDDPKARDAVVRFPPPMAGHQPCSGHFARTPRVRTHFRNIGCAATRHHRRRRMASVVGAHSSLAGGRNTPVH